MKTLWDAVCGSTVTVRKVTGGRTAQKELERRGIMNGTDLTVLELLEAEGALRVDAGRGELLLSREEAMRIGVGEHFVRKNDPILLGGCCASGNMTELFKRMEDCFEEEK